MIPACSTVACPEWTLERVAAEARRMDYDAVELRTFSDSSTDLACDPALTDPAKTASLFARFGVRICCLASSLRYDQPIRPPVIGRVIGDEDAPVRQTRRLVRLARDLGCPLVRVFGFELAPGESRRAGLRRTASRLRRAADTCRNTGVRLVVENGGSFQTAAQLAELLDAVDASQLLAAAYSPAVGQHAGCSLDHAFDTLGDSLAIVKLKELRDGSPVSLGEGELGADRLIHILVQRRFAGPVVYEHNRIWNRDLPDPAHALEASCRFLYSAMARHADTPDPAMRDDSHKASRPPPTPTPHHASA